MKPLRLLDSRALNMEASSAASDTESDVPLILRSDIRTPVYNYGASFVYVIFYKDNVAIEAIHSGFTRDVPLKLEKDVTYKIGLGLWDSPTRHPTRRPIRSTFYTRDHKINFVQKGMPWYWVIGHQKARTKYWIQGMREPGPLHYPVHRPKALLLSPFEATFQAGLTPGMVETWVWVISQHRHSRKLSRDQLYPLHVKLNFWVHAE